MATAVRCPVGRAVVVGSGVTRNSTEFSCGPKSATPVAVLARRVKVTAKLASANHGGRIAYVSSCSHVGVASQPGNVNIAGFLRGAPLRRRIQPRQWRVGRTGTGVGTRVSNPNSVRLPMIVSPSCCGLIKKATRFVLRLLPSKAAAEAIEAEVDAAAAFIEKGAGIVTDIANEIEAVANTAEATAEEVEQAAAKIEDVAMKIKKKVDDVANLIEGEEGALTQKVEELKAIAEVKRAEETSADQAAPSAIENGKAASSDEINSNQRL